MKLCRHCGRNKANRRRGLCWSCYYEPGVRERYEVKQGDGFSRRGFIVDRDFYGGYRPPPEPTTALPGTEEKAAALAERVRLRVSLWHPRDADRTECE